MKYMYGGVYIPNLANTAEQYGIGEYRFAHNYELCGQKFELKAGDKVCVLEFAGGHPDGGFKATLDGVEAEWECEKLEKDLYFVRLGDTAIALWLEGGKAVVCPADGDPVCCTIGDGEAPVEAGDMMVETQVRWTLGVNRYIDQIFCAPGKAKTAWSRNTVNIGNGRKSFRDAWEPAEADYNDEDIKAVSISDRYFLVVQPAPVIPEGVVAPTDIKRIVMLQDYDRTMVVGCAFGDEPIMLAGYGKFLDR